MDRSPSPRRPEIFLLLTLWTLPAGAQLPQEFTNLQLFPQDIERRQLVEAMRQFAQALGVRCNHCHVGEDPANLEGYDFASDEPETKRVAREMMKMTQEINRTLMPKIGREAPTHVRCITCHHGTTLPRTLDQILAEALEDGGPAAAVARYRELRQESYGRGLYDFGERTLLRLAEEQAELERATPLLELNLEHHPESWMTHFSLGEVYRKSGDTKRALEHYTKAAGLAPENRRIQARIRALSREG